MLFESDTFLYIWHNCITLLLLFFALKKEQHPKRKILAGAILLALLVLSYFSETSYNLTAVLITCALFIKDKFRQCLFVLLTSISFFYSDIRVLFFQKISGEKTSIPLMQQNPTAFITPHQTNEQIEITQGDLDALFIPVMDAEINARIVYIDEYDKKFAFKDYYSHPLYDALAPLDVTIFIESMADNWKKFKIRHEQRGAWVFVKNNTPSLYKPSEWSNVHIIPKNQTIRNGFKTIKRGDIVKIEGFFVDWQGTGAYDYFKIQTARNFADISEQKLGGQETLLCIQFFVTKLFANGYVFE